MRRSLRSSWLRVLAIVCAIVCAIGSAPAEEPAAMARVAVAWNRSGSAGSLRAMSVGSPWDFRTPSLETGQDATIRFAGGRVFVVSRKGGTVAVVDPATWSIERTLSLGPGAEPLDIAVAGPELAYVTRAGATHLLRLNLATGAAEEATDLGRLADDDGVPDLGLMEMHEGRLFVQVRRYNAEAPFGIAAPAYLAVVDIATGQEVDADPAKPGTQAIELQGTAPKQKMQVLAQFRRLFVSATGGFHDAGGIEVVDLDALRTLGLVIREDGGQTGADLGTFVMTTPEQGFLVFSTDLDLSSHLKRFTLSGGVEPGPERHVTVGYFMPALVHDPGTDTLFVPDGAFGKQGVYVFDAATGERLTPLPAATDGAPADLALIAAGAPPRPRFIRGDCDGDGAATGQVTDAVYLLGFLFLGGPAPPCAAACDGNGDGEFSGQVTDAVYFLGFSFLGGPPPPAPFPSCGMGSELDLELGCRAPPEACRG